MARTKIIDGVRVNFTAEEETARDAEEAQVAIEKEAHDVAKIAKQERLASVKSKLENLGLTTEEVQEAFGL